MNVEVIMGDGEEMYFFGSCEIEKPKRLAVPVREIVAFSEKGLGGKRVFTAGQVANVKDMDVAETPAWLG
ncbi:MULTISPECIES: hypothetical protein [Gammaproteobacteria]|uniref:hypothetical protein n=1 Tax=Gammaproteobacteria TaxID=1236 RepID=UPI001CC58891|nr:hypothetical protein [Aeromonas caviae]HDT5889292.1 hypothetical protein [Aeromonas dhakensis]HEB4980317.1 hypothetical protein [Aeromonas dhakensis]